MTKKAIDLERRIQETRDKAEKYERENSIHTHKSEFRGCKTCGSKLAMKYLKGEYCPLCKADLRSETVIKTLNGYKKKVIELYAELKKEMGKDANQVQQVTPKQGNNAFKKAYNELIDRVDYVLEERNGPDFKEVVYSIGGDVITARIMKDGQIYER